MGTHPIEMVLASGLGLLSLVNTVESRAGISVRLATGTRSVTPGSRTDPLGKGSIGRVWDLFWPIVPQDARRLIDMFLASKDLWEYLLSRGGRRTCEGTEHGLVVEEGHGLSSRPVSDTLFMHH